MNPANKNIAMRSRKDLMGSKDMRRLHIFLAGLPYRNLTAEEFRPICRARSLTW